MRTKGGNVRFPTAGRFPPALITSEACSTNVEVLGYVQSAESLNCFQMLPATCADFANVVFSLFVARIRQSSFAKTSPSVFRIEVMLNTHNFKTSFFALEFPPALPPLPDDDGRSLPCSGCPPALGGS